MRLHHLPEVLPKIWDAPFRASLLDVHKRVRYDTFSTTHQYKPTLKTGFQVDACFNVTHLMKTAISRPTASSTKQDHYPKPSVTVDVVLFTFVENELRVLLIKRNRDPFIHHWALPGGFVTPNEKLEEAAARELYEETHLRGIYLEQLYTFGDPGRDPRGWVISVAYFSIIGSDHARKIHAGDDAGDAAWFNVYDLPQLAFDHKRIILYALQRLRYKLEYTGLGFLLLPESFTLSQLQTVYETVLEEKLDKRNFRKKILSLGVIEETGKMQYGDHRPAKRYRFTSAAIELEKARRKFP